MVIKKIDGIVGTEWTYILGRHRTHICRCFIKVMIRIYEIVKRYTADEFPLLNTSLVHLLRNALLF